ncbi:tRNA lysidine(34) synthetase TilS [Candidatus Palibaumannia cicadellinicola]|uniref:tRNA(Ile)-lysidine synthase n=1 Tax=Candidatus Palibaumannia cicadellinicola TaxID=186490 RepID=A0A0K2BKX8_9GAMM|nr:tRNA lysidine(34) synthetase TilS [Candidatus Baumannia cicadellinicola]AKZ65703.1 tRNA(Ile)-lysidine synthetase [Candidatus Baumannia cicadellinicola]
MKRKVDIDHIRNMLQKHVTESIIGCDKVLLAFSGGLDSTVLLNILQSLRDANNFPLSLRAIHINHGLSSYSDFWVQHCEQQCKQRAIPFTLVKVNINNIPDGIEAAARNARYIELYKALLPGEVLLTAQHQDDQAETLLLALKRGSGPSGLSAMSADTSFGCSRLLRPLLNFSKLQLAEYANNLGLSWIEDDSNNNDRFDRNFLRRRILIPLQQRWPQFSKSVTRSAQLCAEQENLINELLKETLSKIILPNGALTLTPLLSMSNIRRSALLRRWLASQGARMPSRKQLNSIWQDVALSRCTAAPKFLIGDKQLRRFRDNLYLISVKILAKLESEVLLWPMSKKKLILPQDIGLLVKTLSNTTNFSLLPKNSIIVNKSVSFIRAPQPNEHISVRFGKLDGSINIIGKSYSQKLKTIWQQLAVPPWQRGRQPMIFYNQKLITVPGMFVTIDGKITTDCAALHVLWLKKYSINK